MRQVDLPNIFKFEDLCIKRESTCKLLEIILDDRLRFAKQVDSISVKASRQLNALIRMKKNLNRKEKLLLFQSFILS